MFRHASVLMFTLTLLLSAGCDQQAKKPSSGKVEFGSKEWIRKTEAAEKRQKDSEAAILKQLKTDKTPLYELAKKKIIAGIAETSGDDSAKAATVSVDKESLKTFGPQKWTLRGQLSAVDNRKVQRNTTWEVTIKLMFGSLQVTETRLEVRE